MELWSPREIHGGGTEFSQSALRSLRLLRLFFSCFLKSPEHRFASGSSTSLWQRRPIQCKIAQAPLRPLRWNECEWNWKVKPRPADEDVSCRQEPQLCHFTHSEGWSNCSSENLGNQWVSGQLVRRDETLQEQTWFSCHLLQFGAAGHHFYTENRWQQYIQTSNSMSMSIMSVGQAHQESVLLAGFFWRLLLQCKCIT